MTVLGYIKGVLIVFSLFFGVAFLSIGVWKLWSAYAFEKHAEKLEGIFKGYHTVRHESRIEDASGFRNRIRSEESLPMFSYKDAQGRFHDVTGTEGHLFKHLRFGKRVVVLVSPDASAPPRLGDPYSLYGNGIQLCLIATVIFIIMFYGIKGAEVLMGPEGVLRRFGQSRLPVGDMFVMIGGFFLLAGVMMVFGYHWILKRQDLSLVNAMQSKNYQEALLFAREGRGINAETPEGETSLILAIKAGRMDVARAILGYLWINGNTRTADGKSAAQLAAASKEPVLLAMLLKKGAQVFDIPPTVIRELILDGETETLRVIFKEGYDLHQKYNRMTFGDLALIHGRLEIVRLIHECQGLFQAPVAFLALALDDDETLAIALKKAGVEKQHFHGFSLEQYAEKIGRTEVIASLRRISDRNATR